MKKYLLDLILSSRKRLQHFGNIIIGLKLLEMKSRISTETDTKKVEKANERLFDEEMNRQIHQDNLLDELAEMLESLSEEELAKFKQEIEDFEE